MAPKTLNITKASFLNNKNMSFPNVFIGNLRQQSWRDLANLKDWRAEHAMFKQIRKAISIVIITAFISTSIKNPSYAQVVDPMPRMPAPGVMVHLSPEFTPALGAMLFLVDIFQGSPKFSSSTVPLFSTILNQDSLGDVGNFAHRIFCYLRSF